MGSVKGKVVFITGGARGIGAEVGRQLYAKGAKLVLTDLDETALHDISSDLDGDRVLTLVADVRDLASMEGAMSRAVGRFGGVDVVIANAGIATYGTVLNVQPAAFKALIDVNVVGVFHTVRAALPSVIDRRGYVLVVSSMFAYAAQPGAASYCMSKAGVEHFANALALEVAHLGVDVGSAHMGFIDTPMIQDIGADIASFRTALSKLPGPMGKTTSVQACAGAFVNGIERRKRRIYCPRWVGVLRWLRPLLATSAAETQVRKGLPELLSQMDAEADATGRSMSKRTAALAKNKA
ncbi:MAG TPA: SDR family oxidoreductase [Mycobacterium sp.]|nr:SDR family oxidoreductase [Mycobacterium sp.]